MKRNKIAIILVIILGSISFWFIVNNNNSTIKKTLRDFAVEDTASITKIFLADKEGKSVTLERKSPTNWTVNGKYTARIDAIQTLLMTIRKIDVKEPVSKKGQNNVIKRIAAKAVRCEIYQGEKLVKAYYVGTETQDQTGTFMIMINLETMQPSAKPFVTYIPGFEGYLTTRYFTSEKAWRDRTVYQYNPNDIASVKLETPYNTEYGYELTIKGNNDYDVKMLLDNKSIENIDPIAVKQYLSYFQQLSFESFEESIKQNQIDSVLKSKPINILTVTNKSGKKNKVTFYARWPKRQGLYDADGKLIVFDLERMDGLVDNTKDFVILQYYVFGKIMPRADYFQNKTGKPNAQSGNALQKPKI